MAEEVRQRGRPRTFCEKEALENALGLFLQRGFEGTSMSDLTSTLGLTKPSLYAAFGSKEELFVKALTFYYQKYVDSFKALAAEKLPPSEFLHRWFDGFMENFRSQCGREGCLIVNSSAVCRDDNSTIKDVIAGFHKSNEELLTEYFKDCVEAGHLRKDTDPASLAHFYNGVVQGMAVFQRAGQSEDSLAAIARYAMDALPLAE